MKVNSFRALYSHRINLQVSTCIKSISSNLNTLVNLHKLAHKN